MISAGLWPELLHSIWSVILELGPSLLIGSALAGLLHGLLPRDFARRQLRGRGSVWKAVLLGVPLPLCSCGVLPTGLGLKKDGASDGASIGFLISTPQTGVDSVVVSAAFLGWPFALFKVVSAAVTGLVGGLLADRVGRAKVETVGKSVDLVADEAPRTWRDMLDHGLELLRSIWGWLVVGVLISAAIEVLVPAEVFAGAAAWGGLGASLAALVISLPLYVCATASVPIAAALVAGGLPASAALVFLMAGPATNAATVGAVNRSFGGRVLAVYLGTLISGSMLLGWLFDFVLGTATTTAVVHEHGSAPWWKIAAAFVLVAMISFFAGSDLQRAWRRRRGLAKEAFFQEALVLPVSGMTCSGCVAHLEKTLLTEPGVEEALVTLEPGAAQVLGAVSESRLRELIGEAGYQAG